MKHIKTVAESVTHGSPAILTFDSHTWMMFIKDRSRKCILSSTSCNFANQDVCHCLALSQA